MIRTRFRRNYGRKQLSAAYAFVLPAVALLVTFLIIPAFSTIGYSLTDYNIMRPDRISFVGLSNFKDLIQDENFWKALRNTIHFAVFVVPYQCLLALALALLTNVKLKGASFFRAAYFSPMVTSMVVIAILWSVLYNPNPNQGLINAFLTSFGLEPIPFLTSPDTAMNSIVFMSGWQAAGYQMMIFVAGLQGIPQDQYEAASIDGAGKIQQFFYITLPGLKNIIKYVVMITTIQAMKLFTQPYVMTQGGPQNATRTFVYYIYQQGFQSRNFGYACTVATIFFLIVVTLSFLLKRVIKAN